MKTLLKFASIFILAAAAMPASAEITTWIQPSNATSAFTNVLSANQVLEVLSVTSDSSTTIEVTANGQAVTFGNNVLPPVPFIVAGPATIIARKTASGGSGGLLTFRVTEKEKA